MHGFLGNSNEFIVKEMAALDPNGYALQYWMFKPPPERQNCKSYKTNNWLSSVYHHLKWSEGDVPVEEVHKI